MICGSPRLLISLTWILLENDFIGIRFWKLIQFHRICTWMQLVWSFFISNIFRSVCWLFIGNRMKLTEFSFIFFNYYESKWTESPRYHADPIDWPLASAVLFFHFFFRNSFFFRGSLFTTCQYFNRGRYRHRLQGVLVCVCVCVFFRHFYCRFYWVPPVTGNGVFFFFCVCYLLRNKKHEANKLKKKERKPDAVLFFNDRFDFLCRRFRLCPRSGQRVST